MSDVERLKLTGTYAGIENRIVEFSVALPDLSPVSITGHFYYLSFRDKKPTTEEFVEYLYSKIIEFCIPREKIAAKLKRYAETKDRRFIIDLHDQARNLFIRAAKTLKKAGEPGELILFVILEAFLGAPQVACKMHLKTSEGMPVHGSDGVHATFDSKTEELTLIWGESKLYKELSTALSGICLSLKDFNSRKKGRSSRDRDIDILKDYPNIDDPKARIAFLEYFDPYTKQSNKRKELYCCLAGFNYDIYNKLATLDAAKVEDYFKAQYSSRISSACILFKEKILKSRIADLNFAFVLLPFRNVAEFRQLFYAKLGISPSDIDAVTGESDD